MIRSPDGLKNKGFCRIQWEALFLRPAQTNFFPPSEEVPRPLQQIVKRS
jgi:hypothetical protein